MHVAFNNQLQSHMKKRVLFYFAAGLSFAVFSCTDHDGISMVSETDRVFMVKAADGNLFEVKAGEIASMKAVMDSVRHFGEHMVMDHSKAGEEMKALAAKKMVTLPMMVSEAKQKKLDSLSMLSGWAFDSTYMVMMVKSHVETIDLFQTETVIGEDNEVKSFAAGKLPTLHHHLEEAEKIKHMYW
jgi:putative membrane protein